jgi:N-acetylmuramic acid 6-phosphate etherase
MQGKYIEESARDSDNLATEGRNQESSNLDTMSAFEIVEIINNQDALVAQAIKAEIPSIARAVEEIVERFKRGGRLIYIGAGTSGRLGVLDASECPPTFNTPPSMVIGIIAGGEVALTSAVEEAEDNAELGKQDLLKVQLNANDAVVGITASGRTPYVLGALEYARSCGAFTIGLTCNKATPLEALAHLTLAPVTGPEVVSGSTRLKAGTAQKMALNMLSTAAMTLMGKTYGNLMVDVRVSNAKLRRRAVRIVIDCTGLSEVEASTLLERCNGETKVAIVAALAGVSPNRAAERLARTSGVVRLALKEAD